MSGVFFRKFSQLALVLAWLAAGVCLSSGFAQSLPAGGKVTVGKATIGAPHSVVLVYLFGTDNYAQYVETTTSTPTYQRTQWGGMDITDICKYSLSDYEALKPVVAKIFLDEPNTTRATEILQTIKNITIYPKQDLPKIKNGRIVTDGGQILPSGEKLFGGQLSCEKEFNNKDLWYFIFHEDVNGNIIDFDFFVVIDDENFAKRNVPLKPQYLSERRNFISAIESIIREKHLSIEELEVLLLSDGFSVENQIKAEEVVYRFTGEIVRLWHRILPAPGGSGGVITAIIHVNRDGRLYWINREANKIWLR